MNYDRIILELLNRVAALENEVNTIKDSKVREAEAQDSQLVNVKTFSGTYDNYPTSNKKDTTRYLFGDNVYGKNRLVLAVLQAYAVEHPDVSANELMMTFDKNLQGSLGVVRKLNELEKIYPDYPRRFFIASDEIIHTSSEDCVVCNQWGKFNIDRFIRHANNLGFDIKTI